MAIIDPPSGFRDELLAAVTVLKPQIKGLSVFITAPNISDETKKILSGALTDFSRRRALLLALIDSLAIWAQLKNDGYPNLPHIDANEAMRAEIQKTENSIVIAGTLFGAIAAPPEIQDTIERIQEAMQANLAAITDAMQP